MIWCSLLDFIYVHNVNASNMRSHLLVDYVYIMLGGGGGRGGGEGGEEEQQK